MNATIKPMGRVTTLALAAFALLTGQLAALLALTWWYGRSLSQLPDFSGDGDAITLIIAVSTPFSLTSLSRSKPSTSGSFISISDTSKWLSESKRRAAAPLAAVCTQ